MSDTIHTDRNPDDAMTDQREQPQGSGPDVASARPGTRLTELASGHDGNPTEGHERVFDLEDVSVSYSGKVAVRDVNLTIHKNLVTAFIGPSGCGKTTLLRSLNRLNDLIPGAAVEGRISYHGHDLNAPEVDPVEVRRRIGMVFQRPNPFPKSIYDNVAYGLRLHGMKDDLDGRVERALRHAALWDEVKDRLKASGSRSPAASSSASASRVRWRSSRTWC